ncbi:MAG: imidazole glycerol phosphate synthase subunit HisH [Chitinophagaceae bacterium]|nr:imidazole glycerol phosphate synthase subunit HisH [Chitinophagaceae bacterium]MCW5904044.1 imidazole glycerol phosphate synthase subunit HisH [Chitinophagaceae bacterium]
MKQPNIVIIDYGVGNTHSVFNAINFLGYKKVKISDNPEIIKKADLLILPGVGAFDEAINNLKQRGLEPILGEEVLGKKKPILGICVGMQMLASFSEENGLHAGLNWIEGTVKKLELPDGFAVPHVGWNNLEIIDNTLFSNNNMENIHFYFDHSYYFESKDSSVSAYCDYGIKITAAVQKDNIYGVQFHPEKSQVNGLKLFRRFFTLIDNA